MPAGSYRRPKRTLQCVHSCESAAELTSEKWVRLAFVLYRRRRTMPVVERRVVGQCEDLFANALHQRRHMTAREIGAPDGPREDHVAYKSRFSFCIVEDHMARRVTR